MKKLISLALVAIMMFACVASALPAAAVSNANYISYVEAEYFDVKPVIDGYVTEAEWGEITFGVNQNSAATQDETSPSGDNTYFYHDGTYDATSLTMQYEVWLRWDEDYFYIAAKVYDPDGHSLKNGRNSTWNGDALQTRIDPTGANGIVLGDTFDAVNDSTDHKPWGDSRVCDLVFGYCQMAGGFQEAYDNTTSGSEKSMLADSYYTPTLGVCDLAIIPAGSQYSTDSANGITTYEIAIPWAYIDSWNVAAGQDANAFHEYYKEATKQKTDSTGKITQGPNGAIDREYGMSLVVLNADGNKGSGKYNAFLTWGSGICDQQQREAVSTCGGSQSVVLSGTKVSEDGAYTGSYTTYTKGGLPETTPVANYSFDIDTSNYIKLTYDTEADMDVLGWLVCGERVQDTDGNWVIKWDKDVETCEYYPTDSGLNPHNYLSTDGELEDGSDVHWTATNASFTYEFDIKVTGVETFQDNYAPTLYTWFGGADGVSYRCGYFFDDGVFKVASYNGSSEKDSTVLATSSASFELNEWHHWVFQYDNDTCTMRFYIDPEMENGRVAQSATPVFNMFYKYFDYGSNLNPVFILRRMNCQIMLDNVELYNFVDYTKTNQIGTITQDPNNTGSGTVTNTEKTEEVDIDATVEQREDGSFAFAIANQEAFTNSNVTGLSFTVKYDTTKVSFKGVDTIEEGKYSVEDDGNGTAIIKITDLSVLKSVEVGQTLLCVLVMPLDGVTLTTDTVKDAVSIKASITTLSSATGDTIVYISVALAAVMVLGCAVVIVSKKRKNTVQF